MGRIRKDELIREEAIELAKFGPSGEGTEFREENRENHKDIGEQ